MALDAVLLAGGDDLLLEVIEVLDRILNADRLRIGLAERIVERKPRLTTWQGVCGLTAAKVARPSVPVGAE